MKVRGVVCWWVGNVVVQYAPHCTRLSAPLFHFTCPRPTHSLSARILSFSLTPFPRAASRAALAHYTLSLSQHVMDLRPHRSTRASRAHTASVAYKNKSFNAATIAHKLGARVEEFAELLNAATRGKGFV